MVLLIVVNATFIFLLGGGDVLFDDDVQWLPAEELWLCILRGSPPISQ